MSTPGVSPAAPICAEDTTADGGRVGRVPAASWTEVGRSSMVALDVVVVGASTDPAVDVAGCVLSRTGALPDPRHPAEDSAGRELEVEDAKGVFSCTLPFIFIPKDALFELCEPPPQPVP